MQRNQTGLDQAQRPGRRVDLALAFRIPDSLWEPLRWGDFDRRSHPARGDPLRAGGAA